MGVNECVTIQMASVFFKKDTFILKYKLFSFYYQKINKKNITDKTVERY